MGIKRCPKCGSTKLLAKKITAVQVESSDNGEFLIKAEGSKYQIEIIGCAKCKTELDESSLVESIQCKVCGKFTNPENLNANGECDICHALKERPNLANMSKEDLIRMMLKLEKNNANNLPLQQFDYNKQSERQETTTSSVAEEKMKTAQAAIQNVSNTFSNDIIKETQSETIDMQDIMNVPQVQNQTEQPKRAKRTRKKNEEEVKQETLIESANTIATSQDAPFPEQDSDMQKLFQQPQEQEQGGVAPGTLNFPFQMFDSEQSF